MHGHRVTEQHWVEEVEAVHLPDDPLQASLRHRPPCQPDKLASLWAFSIERLVRNDAIPPADETHQRRALAIEVSVLLNLGG